MRTDKKKVVEMIAFIDIWLYSQDKIEDTLEFYLFIDQFANESFYKNKTEIIHCISYSACQNELQHVTNIQEILSKTNDETPSLLVIH